MQFSNKSITPASWADLRNKRAWEKISSTDCCERFRFVAESFCSCNNPIVNPHRYFYFKITSNTTRYVYYEYGHLVGLVWLSRRFSCYVAAYVLYSCKG